MNNWQRIPICQNCRKEDGELLRPPREYSPLCRTCIRRLEEEGREERRLCLTQLQQRRRETI